MKAYLQRLVARAEGVSLTPSIAPAGHSLMTGEATQDSFAHGEPTTSFVRPNRPADSPEDLSPDKDQASTMSPDRRRIGRDETVVMEKMSVPGEIKQVPHAGPVTIEPRPALNDTRSRVLAKTDFRKATFENLENGPDGKVKGARPGVNELIEAFEPVVTERLSTEELSLETRTPVITTSKLEPQRDDALRSEPLASGEPRLVIGQLRVDVVTTAPTQAREVVRTVIRSVGPSQGNKLSLPTSRLRFGLGQM